MHTLNVWIKDYCQNNLLHISINLQCDKKKIFKRKPSNHVSSYCIYRSVHSDLEQQIILRYTTNRPKTSSNVTNYIYRETILYF